MPGTLAPTGVQTVFDINGNPVPGAKIYTYLAGTSLPVPTYTDYALTTPNTNPILADAAGRFVAYLTTGQLYKFLYKTAADVTLYTQDNIPATPSASGVVDVSGVAGEAIPANYVCHLGEGVGGHSAGLWYIASASAPEYSTLPAVIGVAMGPVVAGGTGIFRTAGQVTGFTGLTIGAKYYIGVSGTITTVIPTYARLVGVADTATSLILNTSPAGYFPAWLDMPFSAANFSALGGGTWTVGAPAVITNRYQILGKTLHWSLYVSWFSGSNALAGVVTSVKILAPGGVNLNAGGNPIAYAIAGGTPQMWAVNSGGFINVSKNDGSALPTSGAFGIVTTMTWEIA